MQISRNKNKPKRHSTRIIFDELLLRLFPFFWHLIVRIFPIIYYICPPKTEVVAQLVRASDCGSEGRGFEPRLPPKVPVKGLFCFL